MPRNQTFNFKLSKLDSKNDEDRCGFLCIEPTNSRGLTALTDYTNYQSDLTKTISVDAANEREYFLCDFLFCL